MIRLLILGLAVAVLGFGTYFDAERRLLYVFFVVIGLVGLLRAYRSFQDRHAGAVRGSADS